MELWAYGSGSGLGGVGDSSVRSCGFEDGGFVAEGFGDKDFMGMGSWLCLFLAAVVLYRTTRCYGLLALVEDLCYRTWGHN